MTRAKGLKADLLLWLQKSGTGYTPQYFRVDPGAEVTIMPRILAQRLGLDVPDEFVEESIRSGAGKAVRKFWKGRIRTRVEGLGDLLVFEWPCWFHEDPDFPCLLGTAGIINGRPYRFRFTFDGTPEPPIYPNGWLLVEAILDSSA